MLKEGDKAPVFTIETDKNIFELKFKNDKKTTPKDSENNKV